MAYLPLKKSNIDGKKYLVNLWWLIAEMLV
jgi:hypothetical protein